MKTTYTNSSTDEAEIRRLIADWSSALEAKDAQGLTANYVADAVVFDAIPPYKLEGAAALSDTWQKCLPFFPERFQSEHRDVSVHVLGDTAFVFGMHHIVTDEEGHPAAQTWLRITLCFRRIDGNWKVVHEHVSLPFNPMNNQAWIIRDPGKLEAPDYSQSCCGGGAS